MSNMMSTGDKEQTLGPWTPAETEAVLASIERYGGLTSALANEICERTGRSEPSVMRKLLKIGHLRKRHNGIVGFSRALGSG